MVADYWNSVTVITVARKVRVEPRAEIRTEVAPMRSVPFDSARSAALILIPRAARTLISRAARALTLPAARTLIPRAARRGYDSARIAGL